MKFITEKSTQPKLGYLKDQDDRPLINKWNFINY